MLRLCVHLDCYGKLVYEEALPLRPDTVLALIPLPRDRGAAACRARGIHPMSLANSRLISLPLFLVFPLTKRTYGVILFFRPIFPAQPS